MDRLAEIDEYNRAFRGALTDEDFLAAGYTPEEISAYRGAYTPARVPPQDIPGFGTLERVGEQFYAPSGGYADLYADSFLARNKDRTPASVGFAQDYIDFVPFIGDVLGAGEVVQELQKDEPNYPLATALGAATVIGTIPAVGDPIAKGVERAARYVLESPVTADIVGGIRSIPDLDIDFLTARGDPALAQGVGADVPKAPLTFDDVERAMRQTSQDIEFIRNVDRPDIVKDIFRDDEYAADVLGSLRNPNVDFPDAAPITDVQSVRSELYRQTQDRLADLPDEVTVYRAGDLNETDGISSFTLNPNYNPNLDLPWNELRGSPKLEAYTVKKSDILASPDLIRDFGEGEVIIRNSSVERAMAEEATETVPAAPSIDDQIAELDVQVKALRQNVLDNPTDTAAFDEYKRVRQMRNDLKDQRATSRAEARNVGPAVEEPIRTPTTDEGFEEYLKTVNPGGKRVAAEDRPNLMMGDMYGMLPRNSEVISTQDGVTFYRSQDGDYYATAFNPDVGEEDVVGYITDRGDGTELAVVGEMQGQGIGGELQYLFRKERPNAPTGGLTEAGERSLQRTYERLRDEGVVDGEKFGGSTPSAVEETPQDIRLFHGTPHDFPPVRLIEMPDGTQLYQNMDELTETPAGARVIEEYPMGRFDITKIGTGEGAQVYGHGLYFAQEEPVAKHYRSQITDGNTGAARRTLESVDGDIDKAISKTEEALRRLDERAAVGDYGNDERRFAAQRQIQIDKLAQLKHYKETGEFDKGRVYEVEIQGNLDQFLDWDKPLSEQPEIARLMGYDDPNAIAAAKSEEYAKFRVPESDTFEDLFAPLNEQERLAAERLSSMPVSWGKMTGKDAYEAMKDKLGALDWPATADADMRRRYGKEAAEKASSELREAGVLGIQYLDQMSRGAGKGSRNYVVFDDKLISIVKKYGIAGAAVYLGVDTMDVEHALADNMTQADFEDLVSGA